MLHTVNAPFLACIIIGLIQQFLVQKSEHRRMLQDYILPVEYVNTMRDYMLDNCPVSTYRDIAQVIQEDLGKSPGELFASIEEVPIASASLAQVMIIQILSSAYAVSGCFDRTIYFRSCQYSLHIDQVEMVSALQ